MEDIEIDEKILNSIVNEILLCEMKKLYQERPRGRPDEIEKIIKNHVKGIEK